MKNRILNTLTALFIFILPTLCLAETGDLTGLRGIIQYEKPCVLAAFPNGCLRVVSVSPSGPLFYIQRPDHEAAAEFNIVNLASWTNLYQIFFTNLDSVLVANNQPVLVQGLIRPHGGDIRNGGTILRIDNIQTTPHLDN